MCVCVCAVESGRVQHATPGDGVCAGSAPLGSVVENGPPPGKWRAGLGSERAAVRTSEHQPLVLFTLHTDRLSTQHQLSPPPHSCRALDGHACGQCGVCTSGGHTPSRRLYSPQYPHSRRGAEEGSVQVEGWRVAFTDGRGREWERGEQIWIHPTPLDRVEPCSEMLSRGERSF